MKPKYIKRLQSQSRKLTARQIDRTMIRVESVSNPLVSHTVTFRFEPDGTIYTECTCPWAENNGVACSHVMAALEYLAAYKERTLSFWRTRDEAERQKHRLFRLKHRRSGDDEDAIWITSRAA